MGKLSCYFLFLFYDLLSYYCHSDQDNILNYTDVHFKYIEYHVLIDKIFTKKTQQYRGWNFVPADKYDAEV